MALFTGIRDRRIDAKDRLVIPASFVATIRAESDGRLYLVPGAEMPCVEAYPARKFEAMADAQRPDRFGGDQQERRIFLQTAQDAEIKGPGRITLPRRLIEDYFPAGAVRVAGMADYLELWDPETWEQHVGEAVAPRRGGVPGAKGGT